MSNHRTSGTFEPKQKGDLAVQWYIDCANGHGRGIQITEMRGGKTLPWDEARNTIVMEIDRCIAELLELRASLREIDPYLSSEAWIGRISVPSLKELTGSRLLRFIELIRDFILPSLRPPRP